MRFAGVASFVPWLVWALMSATAVTYVLHYGPDLPFEDEFDQLWLLAEDNLRTEWLFAPISESEHRAPLSLLAWWAVVGGANWNFRAGMLLNVALLSLLAAALLVGVRRQSGSLTDTFLPLVVLSLAQHENLLWSFQVLFVVPSLLFGLFLVSVLRTPPAGPPPILAGLVLVLLPLADLSGLALSLPLSAWLLGEGLTRRELRNPRWWPALGGAIVAAGLSTAFLLTFVKPETFPQYDLPAMLRAVLEIVGGSLGPTSARFHLLWAAAVGLMAGSAVASLWHARRMGALNPLRDAGLVACLLASLGLCLAIGYGRGVLGPGALLNPKYTTLSGTLLISLYCARLSLGPQRKRVVALSLLTAALAAMPAGIREARLVGEIERQANQAFAADVATGLNADALLARHLTPRYHETSPNGLLWLYDLHRHRVGSFAEHHGPLRRDTGPRVELELDLRPFSTNDVLWRNGTAQITGPDPYLVFRLEPPREVLAVQVEFTTRTGLRSETRLEAFWAMSGTPRGEFSWRERTASKIVRAADREQQVDFPIYETIDLFRLDPEPEPAEFLLRRITLIVRPS